MIGKGIIGKSLIGGSLPTAGAAAGITISSPAAAETIPNEVTVVGTTDTAAAVEYQIDAGAWATLATPSGGNYSGVITGLVAGARTITVRQSDVPATTATVSVTVVNDAITITSPTAYGFQRRGNSATASIPITFTYTGLHASGFEARFNRTGAEGWATFATSASPKTVTLTGEVRGTGTLEVRSATNAYATASAANFSIGKALGIIGDSNASGRGDAQTAPSGACHMYDSAGGFHPLAYPFDGLPYGGTETYAALADGVSALGNWVLPLAGLFIADGEPVLMIPASRGGTKVVDYARSVSTATCYGAMKARFDAAGGVDMVIVHTGNNDVTAGTAEATLQTQLTTLVSDLRSDFASCSVLINLMNYAGGVPANLTALRNAEAYVIANSAGAYLGGDVAPITALHFGTVTEMADFAARVYAKLVLSYPATNATVTLTTDGTTPAASLTGLHVALFTQSGASRFAVLRGTWDAETTDASGVLSLDLTGLGVLNGQACPVVVTNSDGTVGQTPALKAHVGVVTAAA